MNSKLGQIGQVNFFKTEKLQPLESTITVNATNGKSFKDTIANMINEMNETTNKPQEILNDAKQGKADIHDVMAAVAKSELTVQAAATVTGKILQTYEKIMQITI